MERYPSSVTLPLRGWLLAVIVLSFAGCARDAHDHPALRTGKQLFDHHCAECHGVDGAGRLFDGRPANILTLRDRDGIVDYIRGGGRHERTMPAFAAMPDAEARKIADHLLALKQYADETGVRSPEFMIAP